MPSIKQTASHVMNRNQSMEFDESPTKPNVESSPGKDNKLIKKLGTVVNIIVE